MIVTLAPGNTVTKEVPSPWNSVTFFKIGWSATTNSAGVKLRTPDAESWFILIPNLDRKTWSLVGALPQSLPNCASEMKRTFPYKLNKSMKTYLPFVRNLLLYPRLLKNNPKSCLSQTLQRCMFQVWINQHRPKYNEKKRKENYSWFWKFCHLVYW